MEAFGGPCWTAGVNPAYCRQPSNITLRVTQCMEASDDQDNFRERKWACDHAHESVDHALNCGVEWLDSIVDRAKGQRQEPTVT